MKRLFLIVFVAMLTYSQILQAQIAPAIKWNKTIGGNIEDSPGEARLTSNGEVIIGGGSRSALGGDKSDASKGGWDFWLVTIDANGNKLWDKTYGGTGQDYINDLQRTTDGGYIIGGSSDSGISPDKSQPCQGNRDYWIVKTDAFGNKQWDKTFGSTSDDIMYALQQTSDGGYILGGFSHGGIDGDKTQSSRGFDDYWIIKLDASGNKQWDKAFGGTNNDVLTDLKQTSDGGYILSGYSGSGTNGDKSQPNKGGSDYWILKLDSFGNKIWDKTFGGNNAETWVDILQTSDGGYLLGGTSMSGISGDKSQPNQGNFDFWLVKLDQSGNKQWDKTFGGNAWDELTAMFQTNNGGYIIGGFSESGNTGDKSQASNGGRDYWMLKLNATGNIIWQKSFGGNLDETLFSILPTPDGGYLLTGDSNSGVSGDKTDVSKGLNDFWLVKLGADAMGIEEKTESNFSLYPNPTTGKFNLELKNQQSTQITVFNALGQCVLKKSTSSTEQKPFLLDLSHSAKGIYTIQVISGKQNTIKKVVLE